MCAPYSLVLYRRVLIGVSTFVATHSPSIIDMTVTLNALYLAAVDPLPGLTLFGVHIIARIAWRSMSNGFIVALLFVLIHWLNLAHIPEAVLPIFSWLCALAAAWWPRGISRPDTVSSEDSINV